MCVCSYLGCCYVEAVDDNQVIDTGQHVQEDIIKNPDHEVEKYPENTHSDISQEDEDSNEHDKDIQEQSESNTGSTKDKSELKLPWDASLSYDANGRLVIQQIGSNSSSPTNGTDETSKKIVCKGKNLTEANMTAEVQIINSTELIKKLSSRNSSDSNCVVVMFYAPFCMFSAQTAPHYNALGRVYPQLDILAIDAFKYSG